MNRIIVLLVLLTLFVSLSCTPEQSETKQPKQLVTTSFMDFHDCNKDGVISQDEFKDSTKKLFENREVNGDGVQDKEEITAKIENIFNKWDKNEDQKVTPEEMKMSAVGSGWEEINTEGLECQDNPPRQFIVIDLNQDGVLDKAEYMAFTDKRFKMLDVNGDGFIAMDEMKQMYMKEHSAMDQDGDNIIDFDEFESFRNK